VLTHAGWNAVAGLRHGFLDGAESAGEWDAVRARLRVRSPLRLPKQVHGTRVVSATDWSTPPEADAVWSNGADVLVGIVTADCVPLLLAAPQRHAVAAVHAGWRGAAAGVVEEALSALRQNAGAAADEIEVVIGPAIGGCCYEVGDEVLRAFRTTETAWTVERGRPHVDLRTAVRLLLAAAGVSRVTTLGPCTACTPAYRSYRRDGAGTGRQLSFVGWS
jgi:YfiH family protein